MTTRKAINIVVSLLTLAALVFAGNVPANAQREQPAVQDCGKLKAPSLHQGRIKQKDRQAAADCTAQLGLAAAMAAAPAPAQGGAPDYFGPYPNWAYSPLPGPQAPAVTIDAPPCIIDGVTCIQAAAQTTVSAAGVVASITITNAGLGYDPLALPPNVAIAPPPGGGLQATAAATVDATGAVAVTLGSGGSGYLTGGIPKFVETLNSMNDYYGLTFAQGQACTYSGQAAWCYEIHLQQFPVQMLPAGMAQTMIRGYVERLPNGSFGPKTYLGPTIIAQRDLPVRITFYNDLPTGSGGNLFIPVDTTYMGAGTGPAAPAGTMGEACAANPKPTWCYTENRATLHLHGGTTPWISDGTPHQWITPANENTQYPQGVSVRDVPDMNTCAANNDGCQTFFYSNEQSARLMFYHDHAYGITRLNVYAGEAAGYLLTDLDTTRDPITPVYGPGIPLVIQDRTFVDANTVLATDPTWNWGTGAPDVNGIRPPVTGDLWYPHVYMPNQNPYDVTGANGMGRWDYGPWFWPPFTNLQFGPIPNPYCQPTPGVDCSATPWEPPVMPATPNPSGVPEAFMDTMIVNGKTYPTLHVPADKVRFRILSAGNDRFLNLSLWVADPAVTTPDGRLNTEVKMVPFNSSQNAITPFPSWWYDGSVPNPFDDRVGGVPDPAMRGPAMVQIGTEGGFLPGPMVIKNQPVNYVMNKRDITVGNVAQKSLFLGGAERADVLVDFSKFAGKTLILYNDAPAPVPAADPRVDYFTGDPDQTATGGAPSTLPGYGPNTRTVMQIVVDPGADSSAPVDYYDPAFVTSLSGQLATAFAASQDTIIVPQAAYNTIPGYPLTANNASQFVKIQDTAYTFDPIGPVGQIMMPLKPKAIIEDFTHDYGRMNALLGNEIPNTNVTNQTSIPQGYIDPPVELIQATGKTTAIGDTTLQYGTLTDGTQLWKITHNGVDTHVIHTHMFVMQLVNRVGWDGAIRGPDANELGWKDTYRMNPLEDIIVAVRPIMLTNVPFKLPNSWRPLDVTAPLGSVLGFTNVNPLGNPVTVTNQVVNFGWEYVYHCHILGHEENDMMRPVPVAVPPEAPTMQSLSIANGGLNLKWVDNSLNETAWIIQRKNGTGVWATLATVKSTTETTTGAVVTYNDKTYKSGTTYNYRVFAADIVGATAANFQAAAATGYPTLTANSVPAQVGPPAGVTTILTLTQGPLAKSPVVITWSYVPGGDQTGFTIQRATNAAFTSGVTNFAVGNVTTFTDTSVKGGVTYYYQIRATNLLGSGAWSASKSILVHP